MTTIKRLFVILILLAIAFFIYRGVNPQWADALLVRIKALPEHFSGSTKVTSWTVATTFTGDSGLFLELTWKNIRTWTVVFSWPLLALSGSVDGSLAGRLTSSIISEVTGSFVETGLIAVLPASTSWSTFTGGSLTIISTGQSIVPPVPTPTTKPSSQVVIPSSKPKSSTIPSTSQSHGLSSKDIRDTENLLKNLFQ